MSKKATKFLFALVLIAATFNLTACMNPASKSDAAHDKAEHQAVQVNHPAPDFEALDSNGKKHKLKDFAGKYVVLEWTNHQCPFVVKHYSAGNMQRLQKKYTDMGVVWLSVISSARGKQGAISGFEANQLTETRRAHPSAVILDQDAKIATAYAAKTTPHMFIIDPVGNLVYQGAIDSIKSIESSDIGKATNYIEAAFDDLLAAKAVSIPETTPYGCSVKY